MISIIQLLLLFRFSILDHACNSYWIAYYNYVDIQHFLTDTKGGDRPQ